MAENKELGLDNLKSVDWLNDNAPAPAVPQEPEADTEVSQPEPEAEVETPESTTEVSDDTIETDNTIDDTPTETSSDTPEPEVEEEPELSVIDTLAQRFGYEIEGQFTDDYDGLEKYTSAVANKMAQDQLEGIFEQYPDVREYFQYRANNGDPLKYFQAQQAELDYATITVGDNVAIQRRIIQDGMKMQGFDDDAISKMTDAYEDAGILKDNAEVYLQQLQKSQSTRKQELLVHQERQAAEQRAQAEQYWASIANTINDGQLKGLQIPTRQRKRFYDWMTQPIDKKGTTQRDLDRQKLDQESALALEYLIYQGFDLKSLSQNVSNTKKVESLKAKLKSSQSASTRMSSRSKSTVTKAVSLPSLRDLL